eukprot:scaffold2062_cov181-Ochromonas_danica.AAC.16
MKKSDVLLAKKVVAAKEVKAQSQSLSAPSLSIVNELAQRATTGKTELRKLQYSVSQSLSSTTPSSSLRPQTTSRLPSSSSVALAGAGGRSLEDENFFLPKRRLLRADGASLADVYHSKQEDMWGKIIQAQVKEEEVRKVAQQRQQEEANKRYGVELKRQIVSNRKRAEEERVDHERFAQLEHLYVRPRNMKIWRRIATKKPYSDIDRLALPPPPAPPPPATTT